MTAESKKLIIWCIDAEVAAVKRDLGLNPPGRDHWGQPIATADAREQHLKRLAAARSELEAIRAS